MKSIARVFSPPLIALILGIAISAIFAWIRGVPLYVYLFNLAVFLTIYTILWYITAVKRLNENALVMLAFFYFLVYDEDPFKDFLFIVGVYVSMILVLFLSAWLEKRGKSSAD
ncbi:hypothetical protein ODS41_00040 [Pyrobaculum sp. 3827-6]|jgi:hypothetical protein|uniref:hypothetical protein n=1 Tax=Pyrobaculum sp. 3827-6 TaxID=2983604 RepID=UPI0021D8E831|nr:hypothetical protein [Pyrobaculum sp. 3827-6]MCU7786322.1 hypothetical protein [Pyrobaculum sp. 3827-6]